MKAINQPVKFDITDEVVSFELLGKPIQMAPAVIRDRCRCKRCFNDQTLERQHLLTEMDFSILPTSIEETDSGLTVMWNDGHETIHQYENFVSDREFNSDTIKRMQWPDNFQLPVHSWKKVKSDKAMMKAFLGDIIKYGIVKIADCPVEDKFVEKFAYEFACVREIIFDRVADIIMKPDPYTQGFTSVGLPLHTDCSGYRRPPSLFAFHCLKNSVEGGDNTYADAYKAAELLRASDPAAFETLCTTLMDFRLKSKEHDTRFISTIIELSEGGEIDIVRYANWAFQHVALSQSVIQSVGESLAKFAQLVEDPKNGITMKLMPGELLVVNNNRVLHGRLPFNPSSGERHFQQVYMEIDDVEARYRCL